MLDVNKITGNNLYIANSSKENGSTLSAEEWNALSNAAALAHTTINSIIDAAGSGSSSGGGSSSSDATGVVSVSSKGNTTISATKHINIEPAYVADGGTGTYGDVQIKPGDDITLESHHRASDKRDEITIKTSDGVDNSKVPVKLQMIASNITLSTKGKVVPSGSNDKAEVMNVNVTTGSGKGYLKVRARAIDLRCEEHGGIAIQPKGSDSDGNQNKIKFEHGGGDGLEFGTFNTEKTSIFTDEYRFNKDGVWKMATRETESSGKYDGEDSTTMLKYLKNDEMNNEAMTLDTGITYEAADDFYDFIDVNDEQCTTRDIIRTAQALNGAEGVHTKITDKGNIEIETDMRFEQLENYSGTVDIQLGEYTRTPQLTTKTIFTLEEILEGFGSTDQTTITNALASAKTGTVVSIAETFTVGGGDPIQRTRVYRVIARGINIESCGGIKLKGELDFGSTFNFGETDNGIEFQYKKTKKNATKDCTTLKVVGINNSDTSFAANGQYIAPGSSSVVAEASAIDIINVANDFSSVDADDVEDVIELFNSDGMSISNGRIVCEEPIYIVSMSKEAYTMVNDGDLPSGANNWGGTYESIQFPNVMNDAFIVGDSFTESELAVKLSTVPLPSMFTSLASGSTVVFVVKNKTNNLTWGVKLAKYGSNRSCTLSDLTNIVEWMKENNEGPWSTSQS